MAIGDDCCLGVRHEVVATTQDLLLTAESSVGGGLHKPLHSWTHPTISSDDVPVTAIHPDTNDNTGEDPNFNVEARESMCASGVLCTGGKPCDLVENISAMTESSCVDALASVTTGQVKEMEVSSEASSVKSLEIDLDEIEQDALGFKDENEDMIDSPSEEMDILCEGDSEGGSEDMETRARSISPDSESKESQSPDTGYTSDSGSETEASDMEMNTTKRVEEESSSSSSEDESIPEDSPSPPSADESSPFPSVEEVETRTGISFERTLSSPPLSCNSSPFSFTASSHGLFGNCSSMGTSGYGVYGNVGALCERSQLRSRVMSLLDNGVRQMDDRERCLCRYVLLKTNLNRLQKDIRDERLSYHRRRRHHGMPHIYADLHPPSSSEQHCGPASNTSSSHLFPSNIISPLAGPSATSSRNPSGSYTTTSCPSSSSRQLSIECVDSDDEEPPQKRARFGSAEENKENFGRDGLFSAAASSSYSSEASSSLAYYGVSSNHYTSVCNSSNSGYYSNSINYSTNNCMNHHTNHYSSNNTNYFSNMSHFGNSNQYMNNYVCNNSNNSSSQATSDRLSNSSGSEGFRNNSHGSYSSPSTQVDTFSSSSNETTSSSPSSSGETSNGGFYTATNSAPASRSSIGLRSNLDTIMEAIDQQIMRGSYNCGRASTSSHNSYGSFPSYSSSGTSMENGVNQSGSHIFGSSEGSSYHIFGNNRHSSGNFLGNTSSSSYSNNNNSGGVVGYSSGYSSYTNHYSDSSSSLASQNPCGRSSQLSGGNFQSLVYNSLLASLES